MELPYEIIGTKLGSELKAEDKIVFTAEFKQRWEDECRKTPSIFSYLPVVNVHDVFDLAPNSIHNNDTFLLNDEFGTRKGFFFLKEPLCSMEISIVKPNKNPKLQEVNRSLNVGKRNITSGWDPEIFVVDENNSLIPAFEFLPTKAKSYKWFDHEHGDVPNNQTLYADGFASEFTTHPIHCHGWGMDFIQAGLRKTLFYARKYNKTAKLTLDNFLAVPNPILQNAPLEQIALGCEPSKNAYGHEPIDFGDPRTLPFRSAGGHIHFGLAEIYKPFRQNFIKALDRYLAIPCVALFDGIDNPMRRSFYGRAGEYRAPVYGIEYRVLSNAWLSSPQIAHLVMNFARAALKMVSYSGELIDIFDISDEEVQEIINVCDAPRARQLVEKHWVTLSRMAGSESIQIQKSKQFWLEGIKNSFIGYDDIELNWVLSPTKNKQNSWGIHSNCSNCTWTYFNANGFPMDDPRTKGTYQRV